jgi:CBS domain-containing protein
VRLDRAQTAAGELADARLADVMRHGREALRPDASFEEVARLVTDFDLLAAPVVDAEGRMSASSQRTTSWRSSCPSAGAVAFAPTNRRVSLLTA